MQDMKAKCEEMLTSFKFSYKMPKMESLLLEGDNPAFALLRYISDSRVTTLVLGSCSSNYFTRKQKDMEVPSIVLKQAPDSCNIYVISTNKPIINSRNPILRTEGEHDSHAISKKHFSLSSSSTASKDLNSLSDLSHLISQAHMPGYSSMYYTAAEGRTCQILDDSISDIQAIKGYTPSSSTHSEQAEIKQLRLELESTITLYSQAFEGLVHAQSKVHLLSSEWNEDARRVNAAQEREESLRKIASEERKKYLEAEEEVVMARKLLAEEAYKRQIAELKTMKESLEKQKIASALFSSDSRYRRYTRNEIEAATDFFSEAKLIGEGAYGKVYKCNLDHTLVAIKVLRPDARDRKEEFMREIEVLSHFRHPHIILLLGACPDNGCLVYEYMENGSLEDHIFCKNGRPPLPWFVRFRVAFEIACGLAFLHYSKPEPIVHRDLKPGNILLDKHYVSKIGDVGLAKMIYDVVPDNITDYRASIIAGTLYYMDPEYQRTGTLRPKSDLYSFGVITLQLLAASRPDGLILKFENALSSGAFSDMLDESVTDWPLAEAEELAKIALSCCQLRCRERPDLESEVLPALNRLAKFADSYIQAAKEPIHAPSHYYCPILQEVMDNPYIAADGFTYEHEAIKAWLDRHNISPVTKQRLQHKMLTPNHVLRFAIHEWRRNHC
ncbi:U-box domain-containing 34-like isoform X1 [Olea europaea subsp. europaea]|nr:U-box domain-containing 34-like isoform X1 [Olea europaea subsp. europaea]